MKKQKLFEVRNITSVKDMLSQSRALYGTKTAFMVKPHHDVAYEGITYEKFCADVDAFGTALISLGITHGKKVAIISENRYLWAVTYMAVLNGEGVVCPMDKELADDDLLNLLNVSSAEAVVCSQKMLEKLGGAESILNNAPTVKYIINMDAPASEDSVLCYDVLLRHGEVLILEGDTRFADVNIDPDEAKILLFTSGTTAMSKGVLLSHKNIVTNLMAMCSMIYVDDKDVFLSVLPIHHTYECTCGLMAPLYRGSSIAYCDGLRYIQKNLCECHATIMLGVPALFEAMYSRIITRAKKSGIYSKMQKAQKLSALMLKAGVDVRRKMFKDVIDAFGGSVRMFISGAAAIDVEVLKGFIGFGIDFLQGYGITECSPIVALTQKSCQRYNSVGKAMPCMQIRIDDANDEGVGEIVCKGDNVMLGYFENPDETNAAITDGWFKTGDLGYMDKDGYLYITGRKKNVIVTKNGKNIYPEELEAFINQNEYVKESVVYGKALDDGETIISAVIVPDMERISAVMGDSISDERIAELMQAAVDAVNKRNPLYKYIRNVKLRKEDFKKTTTQKIKRYLVE